MRGRIVLAGACALALGMTARAEAQSATIALVPGGGYAFGYVLAEDADYSFDMLAAPFISVGVEFTVNKNISIIVGGLRTIGQKMEFSFQGNVGGESDVSQTMLGGGLVLRPGGRTPTGAPTPLFIEAGGGMNLWSFGNFIAGSTTFPADDLNANKPYFYAGAGITLPIGPRAQLNIFGRANFITAYTSQALDDFNATPPQSTVEGKFGPSFMAGIGLRVGR